MTAGVMADPTVYDATMMSGQGFSVEDDTTRTRVYPGDQIANTEVYLGMDNMNAGAAEGMSDMLDDGTPCWTNQTGRVYSVSAYSVDTGIPQTDEAGETLLDENGNPMTFTDMRYVLDTIGGVVEVAYGSSDADGVDPVTETIDYAKMRELALSCRPKLIVVGASAYPRIIDFEACRKIADEVGAYLMVDMAHIAGLVAAGAHPSPIPYAHVVTTTTHKTLRGPRGGMILCREELAKQIDKAIFPGTQGGPLMHIIAAKAVALGEAMTDKFRADQFQTVKNAAVLAEELMGRGLKLVSGGTDNHLMLLKLTGENITGKDLEKRLDTVHITANKNTIPGEPLSPFITSGLRLGTPAVTSRGFRENEMVRIAGWITDTIRDYEGTKERVTEEVLQLCSQFPLYPEMAV